MRNLLIIIVILLSGLNGFGQVNSVWNADTVVNELGDTTIFPEVKLSPIESSERYDNEGNLTWRAKLISNDTIKETTFYVNGKIKDEFTIVLPQPIDTILHYQLLGSGKFVRKVSFWGNGVLKNDLMADKPHYKMFNDDGTILTEADSCDSSFSPSGFSKLYDSKTKNLNLEGNLFPCGQNRVSICEDGWWKYYTNGVLVEMKLYDKGKLIETKKI